MSDASLIAIDETEIARHVPAAQSLITRFSVLDDVSPQSVTEIAGTKRRFVSTVSTRGQRSAREVTLEKTIANLRADDPMLSPAQHRVLFVARRSIAIGLAAADEYAKASGHDARQKLNSRSALEGLEAEAFHAGQHASAYVAAFAAAAYLSVMIDAENDPSDDASVEPDFHFDTPLDALKGLISGLETAILAKPDEALILRNAKTFGQAAINALLMRRGRFVALGAFANAHIGVEKDDFALTGFDAAPGLRAKPLTMAFKRPDELVGNHIAKAQAERLAKMVMAYDFDTKRNPFVDLGGFIFTFIGDGAPGTGKTTLIQMMAGLIKTYCDVASVPFVFQNFGADQISSYQGKSGQNCKAFIDTILNPKAIGFGTIDDVDQVAAKRSDDRASAGQHEITAVLMEAFSGASTVIRGNCTFGMFSNYPENVDDALRQRAGARFLVDGPQTEDDYIDIFALLAGKNHHIPLGDHTLFASQAIKKAVSVAYESHNKPKEEGLVAVYERYLSDNGAPETIADIGAYLHAIKQAEPRFTGRAIKNVTDAIKMRAMDIDLPPEWFEQPDAFMRKDYDTKHAMIAELRGPFTVQMVMQEINRYADSEFRYSATSDQSDISKIVRDARLRERAIAEIELIKSEGRWDV